MKRLSSWALAHPLLILILFALVVRAGMLLAFPDIFAFERTGAIHGSEAYDAYALNLIETGIYGREAGVPDAAIAPLYSYLLAAVYTILGRSGLAVGLVHTLFDLISIALLVDIGARLFNGRTLAGRSSGFWAGWLAGLFTAFYPYLIFQNLTLIDTPLWMLLLNSFVWLIVCLRERPNYDRRTLLLAVGAGLILGISLLTRALLPLLAIFAALWFLMRWNLLQTILRLLPVAIVGMLIVLPWTIRAYDIYDAFVAVALNSGDNFYQGANPMTVPLFEAGYDAQWATPPPGGEDITGRYERNQFLLDAGWQYLRENPERIPELLWVKFLVHWSVEITPRRNPQPGITFALDEDGQLIEIQGEGSITGVTDANTAYDSGLLDRVGRPVHILYFGSLLVLSVVGIILSLPLWRQVSILWFVQITMTVMYLLFHPSTRYRAPSDPLLFLFAGWALLWGWAYLQKKAHRDTGE